MAFATLFTLLDDITAVLDDVALMTKVAAKKTAGVLGDDLALNAQQVSGVKTDREWPIVWRVAKGSFINKLILVPLALAIAAFMPKLITPLLMIGGAYLCFEGVEKIAHSFFSHDAEDGHLDQSLIDDELIDEEAKIKGAIRTDFILSAEIVTIALGTVSGQNIWFQAAVISLIAVAMTVGVYGLVAGIVKIDDVGFWLMRKSNAAAQKLGQGLIALTPYLMRTLGIVGTLAMFLVGGGIVAHGLPHEWLQPVHDLTGHAAGWVGVVLGQVVNLVIGLIIGSLVLLAVKAIMRLRPNKVAH